MMAPLSFLICWMIRRSLIISTAITIISPSPNGLNREIDRYFGCYQDPVKSGLRVVELPQHNLSEAWRQRQASGG